MVHGVRVWARVHVSTPARGPACAHMHVYCSLDFWAQRVVTKAENSYGGIGTARMEKAGLLSQAGLGRKQRHSLHIYLGLGVSAMKKFVE